MIETAQESALVGVLEQVLHHHFTQALQGLLPCGVNSHKLKQVLDVNCRIGAWAIDLALSYPGVTVTALDCDPEFIAMARRNAEVAALNRARFYEADLLKPLQLADGSFDFVHQFSLAPFFRPDEWPIFLQECMRVMKPGAVINLVSLSLGPSSSDSYQQIVMLVDKLMRLAGYGFADRAGLVWPGVHLCRLLREAGFANVTYVIRPVDFGGWNNSAGRACCQLLLNEVKKFRHLFLHFNLIDGEEFDMMTLKKQKDFGEVSFCSTGAIISAFAVKR